MLPLVSIIIPVYNGSNYMRQAIDSALEQTYRNIEIIVINDGSNDDGATERIALSYGNQIRYFAKENGGVSTALNTGIRNMCGEYFSWLSHDDIYVKDKIEKQVEALQNQDGKTVILCKSDFIDENSTPLLLHKRTFRSALFPWRDAITYVTRNGANGCAFLIPKEAFEVAGLFDENLRYCQDIMMWWNIFLSHYSLFTIETVGVHSRIHKRQITQTRVDLYEKDAYYIGDIIPQKFAAISTKECNCILEFAKAEAIRKHDRTVSNCICTGKKAGVLSLRDITMLRVFQIYGRLRPLIKKMYMNVVRGVN